MKIRIIAIIYTVLILGCGLYLWNSIGKKTAYKIDMLDLNTKCDEISGKLSSGADIDALEKEYSCDIVLLSDNIDFSVITQPAPERLLPSCAKCLLIIYIKISFPSTPAVMEL